MAVQAQLYSDYFQNNSNNNMGSGFSNVPQDWVFSIGDQDKLPLLSSSSSSYQQQEDQRYLDSQKIMNSSDNYHNLVSSSNSRRNGIIGFQNLSSELERQKLEMDCFLHFQNEKLKSVLSEETRKRELILMYNYETKMKAVMDAKDEVLTTATNRTTELENYLQMAEKESKKWEKKAIENEAIVTDLNRKLIEVKERNHEDAESICNGDDEKERQKRMVCKMCHVRSSCILLLPCRHLCCCRGCEGLLSCCPVCETVKNGSLEVFFGQG